jgi:hypothetical protein
MLVERETRILLKVRIETKWLARGGEPYEVDGDLLLAILSCMEGTASGG